jgi:RNA polymerase sigma factor (sigma-70 family)
VNQRIDQFQAETMTAASDAELVRAAQSGDARALEELLERYQPQLWRYVRRMCGSTADAEDALQDGLLAAVRGLGGYRGDAALRTWLFSIVRHACWRRRRQRAAELPSTAATDAVADDEPALRAPGPEQQASSRQLAAAVPLLVYALLGQSPRSSIGPVAIDSLLLAAAVTPLAQASGANRVELALLLTFLVGVLQLLFAAARLGFVANFLSRPVLSGFTAGAALLIGASQLGPLSGIALPNARIDEVLAGWGAQLRQLHAPTLALGLGSWLATRWLSQRWPRWPSSLAVVAVATVASALLRLDRHGVAVVGAVPAGLPRLASPLAQLALWRELLPAAGRSRWSRSWNR